MTEGIGAIQNWGRFGAERSQRAPSREEVAHQRFAAGNELVGEHEPGTRLQFSLAQRRGELGRALGPDLEIILEDDCLPIQEKAHAVGRRVVEKLVDERDEPLPKTLGGMIPLAIPVGVGDYVNGEQYRRGEGLGNL